MPPSLSPPPPPLSRHPPHTHTPSASRHRGWIPAFISTIQPRRLLATQRGSFNCPPTPHHPAPYTFLTAIIHVCCCASFFFPPLTNTSPVNTPSVWLSAFCGGVFFSRFLVFFFFCLFFPPQRCTCFSGLAHSNRISATLEADRQAGGGLYRQDVSLRDPAGAQNTHARARRQSGGGKTGVGPHTERPLQNQLAFKLTKRVMKRVLSLPRESDRQASELIVNGHRLNLLKRASKTFK